MRLFDRDNKKTVCHTKKTVIYNYVAQNVGRKKIMGRNVWWLRPTFCTLSIGVSW